MSINNEYDVAKELEVYFRNQNYWNLKIDGISENEFWLINIKSKNFHVIRITFKKNNDINEIVLKNINHDLHKQYQMNGGITSILNIEIGFDSGIKDIEGVVNVHYNGDYPSLNCLSKYYPSLETYFIYDSNSEFAQVKKPTKLEQIFNNIKNGSYITYLMMAICVLFFIISALFGYLFDNELSIMEFIQDLLISGNSLINSNIVFGAYYRTFVNANGEIWRFLTCGFLHGNIIHLLMNMISLRNLGISMEKIYKHKNYLIILISSIIVGTLMAHLDQNSIMVVGISGGIYGLFGAYIVYVIKTGLYRNRMILNALLFNTMSCIIISTLPNISLAGHLGGLACGILMSVILFPGGLFSFNKQTKINFLAAMIMMLTFLGYRGYQNNISDKLYIGTDIQIIDLYQKVGINTVHLEENLMKYYVRVSGE